MKWNFILYGFGANILCVWELKPDRIFVRPLLSYCKIFSEVLFVLTLCVDVVRIFENVIR